MGHLFVQGVFKTSIDAYLSPSRKSKNIVGYSLENFEVYSVGLAV